MPRTAAGGNYPRTAAEVAAPTGSVGRAGLVAASEIATGVVVGSAVILAPASARGPLHTGERLPPDVGDRQPGHRRRRPSGGYIEKFSARMS
jgi:hypothetical protein